MNIDVQWTCSETQKIFKNEDIFSFTKFWKIEKQSLKEMKTECVRQHKARYSQKMERSTRELAIRGKKYFLKRFAGNAFPNIINEFEALRLVEKFNFQHAEAAAYAFDSKNKKGFILLKNLDGFYSLDDIFKKKTDINIQNSFENKKENIYRKIIMQFRHFQQYPFFYPDWFAKHIFINPENKAVALIDLERFIPISKCPVYYKFKFVRRRKRRKEKQNLAEALKLPDNSSYSLNF